MGGVPIDEPLFRGNVNILPQRLLDCWTETSLFIRRFSEWLLNDSRQDRNRASHSVGKKIIKFVFIFRSGIPFPFRQISISPNIS